MLGHGARPWGILPTEPIPRDGLKDLRRELGVGLGGKPGCAALTVGACGESRHTTSMPALHYKTDWSNVAK